MAEPSRSMTYLELGEALRILPTSAARLAKRRRWPRTKGNDGRARVEVPLEALQGDRGGHGPRDSQGDSPPDVEGDDLGHVPADVASLRVDVARLEAQLEASRHRAADLERDRDRWADQADRLASRVEQLEGGRIRALLSRIRAPRSS